MDRNTNPSGSRQSRREFIKKTSAGSAFALIAAPCMLKSSTYSTATGEKVPWYRRTLRWGQTNINEMDPTRYDIEWWRMQWKRTRVQGLVINAGGIVAYYPSKLPLHYRAKHLGNRDLYGELTRAAHEDGIVVLARMDSNRAHEEFYKAHRDWFAVDINGKPYMAADRYVSCIDSPYYEEYLPKVLREIIAWERPEGFTDNSWSGLSRNEICYCEHSKRKFHKATGKDLPRKKDWDDPVYRKWIRWSYARRVEIWDLNNRTTKEAGGSDCLWLGMIGGDLVSQGVRFRDIKSICERTEVIMLDDQGRDSDIGFQENAEMGKRLHGLLGWEKIIPESMAMYQRAPTFRKTAAPKAEARMWMLSGIAGTIQPWWHHVGAYQWDRRQFRTAEPVYRWYEANQDYLVNRRPVATVGVIYSQQNADFYGRDKARELVALPYYGMIQALVHARIPYLPVHIDHVDRDGKDLSLLILPNLGAMSDSQVASVRRFEERGGGLLATGETSLYNEWGERRQDFALADIFGAHFTGKLHGSTETSSATQSGDHTYLRLIPDVGKDVYGPRSGDEPVISGKRHDVLKGFEETDILSFGGLLLDVQAESETVVPVTFIPHFPIYPPEFSWMQEPRTKIAALVLRSSATESRCAYLAADMDRRFAQHNLPDHGDLLANLIRWACKEDIPLKVEGKGLVDCHLYRQRDRLILHVVNLTSAGTWRAPIHELIPIGPLKVSVKLSGDVTGKGLEFLVSRETGVISLRNGWATFELRSLLDHEVAVME